MEATINLTIKKKNTGPYWPLPWWASRYSRGTELEKLKKKLFHLPLFPKSNSSFIFFSCLLWSHEWVNSSYNACFDYCLLMDSSYDLSRWMNILFRKGTHGKRHELRYWLCQMALGLPFSAIDIASNYKMVIIGFLWNSSCWKRRDTLIYVR